MQNSEDMNMRSPNEIQESILDIGVRFITDKYPIWKIRKIRKRYIKETAMMWICNRTKISHGYLDQGHTLIMIWLN